MMENKVRLDKYLADSGAGTRSEVKKMIRSGLTAVNGEIIRSPEYKTDPAKDRVFLQGQEVKTAGHRYFMLNKPAGVITATKDRNMSTVMDLISPEERKDLFPVGRLDLDTEGLLLLTDDGQLGHHLTSPRRHVEKRYLVRLRQSISADDIKAFAAGLDIGDEKKTLPAVLKAVSSEEIPGFTAEVTIQEGRYHQVKRMFLAVGNEVQHLKRISMGPLVLDDQLKSGEYRELTLEEVEALRRNLPET